MPSETSLTAVPMMMGDRGFPRAPSFSNDDNNDNNNVDNGNNAGVEDDHFITMTMPMMSDVGMDFHGDGTDLVDPVDRMIMEGENDDDDDAGVNDMTMMQAFLDEQNDNDNVDDDTDMMMFDPPIQTQQQQQQQQQMENEAMKASSKTTRQISDSTHETIESLGEGGSTSTSASASEAAVASSTPGLTMTGRPGIPLYLSCNPDYLSPYQCLVRKHVELFEASPCDIVSRIKGRNKAIVLGQVGIRCIHCSHLQPSERDKGSMYFPSHLVGVYQAAQILSQQHLLESCQYIPSMIRQELMTLRDQKKGPVSSPLMSFSTSSSLCSPMATSSSKVGGKEYWAKTAQALGVYEDDHGLRFESRLGVVRHHD